MPHSKYLPAQMGSATIEPVGAFQAGSYQSFTLTYTAGYFGIDDTGSIKVVHRFASDMGRPQFSQPSAANYVTAQASNGAILHLEYDTKRNIRPWDKTLFIKVVRGFLRKGDQIIVRFGDPREGSPGMRLQTFCEDTFEFRVLVDAIATYNYVELPKQPTIKIVPGKPEKWIAILPTLREVDDRFRLCIKGEDCWGNPSNECDAEFTLRASLPVAGLPETVSFETGDFSQIVSDLCVFQPGKLIIEVLDEQNDVVCFSNPMQIVAESNLLPYWGDLHGQSEETIGTNSARDFHAFARDMAFLDAVSHQGNDFQITTEFWRHLNDLTTEFNNDNEFITFPGYEWSGNTGLGGDRNVLYLQEGRPLYRSSHALVDDLSDIETDANSAEELFTALAPEDCVVFAHIGGRYADITMAHDIRLERSVEVHSAWGTFEWLIEDALKQGYRVGIVSNSDGHKGRPGASHPGATKFGSYGGLTCMLAPSFTRTGLMESLRKRHHYATTGCRMFLDIRAHFDSNASRYCEDPNLGRRKNDINLELTNEAMMGDIVSSTDEQIAFSIAAHGSAPIERVEIRNGLNTLETYRPYKKSELGSRIRVIWEGSEYRGRGRETQWDGTATLVDNSFSHVLPINRYNIDKPFEQISEKQLEWEALTTGGFGGFDAWLNNTQNGILKIDTKLVKVEIPITDIGYEDTVYEAGGIGRTIRIFRLPDNNPHYEVKLEKSISLNKDRDNALYVRITQEDGHLIWSSPIYVLCSKSQV